MRQHILFLALAVTLGVLGTSSKAQAWGAYHAGYTHVGAGGVSHYGYSSAHGAYGSYGESRSVYGTSGSVSHYGSSAGVGCHGESGYHYSGTSADGYHYGASAYHAGVYRAW